MHLEAADPVAQLDRFIGYYESYAESHEALDRDECLQKEVRHATELLAAAAHKKRGERNISHRPCDEVRAK